MNAKAPTGERDLLHLKYGQNEQNKFDLFLPESYNERTAVILMFHGDAWMMGGNEYTDKRLGIFVTEDLLLPM